MRFNFTLLHLFSLSAYIQAFGSGDDTASHYSDDTDVQPKHLQYTHESIDDQACIDAGITDIQIRKRIYFGNWLRDWYAIFFEEPRDLGLNLYGCNLTLLSKVAIYRV